MVRKRVLLAVAVMVAILAGGQPRKPRPGGIPSMGEPPEIQHGFLPEPSIATSLPNNGDPAGYRKWLGQRGVVYGLEYTNDVLSNVRGGTRAPAPSTKASCTAS